MKNNRVIVAGGRYFNDWDLLKMKVSFYTIEMNPDDLEIVSGGCKGADKLGERYAKEYKLPCRVIGADWGNWLNAAGPMRNQAMAKYATHLIAFWDGKSKGTKNMIDEAKAAGLKIKVVRY